MVHHPHDAISGGVTPSEMQQYDYQRDVLLMVGDWFHRSGDDILAWYANPASFGNEPVPDSLLINGKGQFDCSMAVAARPVECKAISEKALGGILGRVPKRTRLRLVNVGSVAGFSVSVSEALLQPIQVDGGSGVQAPAAHSLGIVYPGERVDVVLQSDTIFPKRTLFVSLDNE